MAIGASGILGIEIESGQIRMVRAGESRELLGVYDFSVEELLASGGENSARQLEALIEREKLRSYPVALALSGPGVVHRQMDFPPMPASELSLVVEREVRAVGAGGEEPVFDWEVIDEVESGNLRQVRVLIGIAPKAQVDGALELLARCGLKTALLTTGPVALLRSLRLIQGGERGSRALLYLARQRGYLLGAKDGAWNFYREFSGHSGGTAGEALLEEAVREASRAQLYHRQRYRDGDEVGFLLCGEQAIFGLKERLEQEIGVQAEVVQPAARLDLSPLGGQSRIFRGLFPSLVIPVGLVAAAHQPTGINLAPKTTRKIFRRRPTFQLPRLQRPLLGLVLLGVLLAGYLVLDHVARGYGRILQERTALRSQWLPAIRAAEESRALRENEKLLEQSLGASRIGEPEWTVLFKTLSLLVEPDMALQSMTVQKESGKWIVALKGEVVSRDAYAAQVAFNRFYRGLKSSPYLEQIELLPLRVATVKERVEMPTKKISEGAAAQPSGGGESPPAAVEVSKTKVQFELRGQAKES